MDGGKETAQNVCINCTMTMGARRSEGHTRTTVVVETGVSSCHPRCVQIFYRMMANKTLAMRTEIREQRRDTPADSCYKICHSKANQGFLALMWKQVLLTHIREEERSYKKIFTMYGNYYMQPKQSGFHYFMSIELKVNCSPSLELKMTSSTLNASLETECYDF